MLQVGMEGLISVGEDYKNNTNAKFPIEQRVIAPYWYNIDTEMQGTIEYKAFVDDNNDSPLEQVNNYFSDRTDILFQASEILVVKWIDVCARNDEKCINESGDVSRCFAHAYKRTGICAQLYIYDYTQPKLGILGLVGKSRNEPQIVIAHTLNSNMV